MPITISRYPISHETTEYYFIGKHVKIYVPKVVAPFLSYKKEVMLMSTILKDAIKALVNAVAEVVLTVISDRLSKKA